MKSIASFAQVWRGLFLGVGDSSLQVHGGRRGWRYFAMYASQVARAAIGMVGMKFGLSPGELFLCVVIA